MLSNLPPNTPDQAAGNRQLHAKRRYPRTMKTRSDAGLPPRGTPKNYLAAWLLVMLRRSHLHGYEIMKELREEFGIACDPGTLYRTLRQLEGSALIVSHWDSHDQGPARRVYELTERGSDALERWNDALHEYRTNLDAFFRVYSSAAALR